MQELLIKMYEREAFHLQSWMNSNNNVHDEKLCGEMFVCDDGLKISGGRR